MPRAAIGSASSSTKRSTSTTRFPVSGGDGLPGLDARRSGRKGSSGLDSWYLFRDGRPTALHVTMHGLPGKKMREALTRRTALERADWYLNRAPCNAFIGLDRRDRIHVVGPHFRRAGGLRTDAGPIDTVPDGGIRGANPGVP